MRLRTLAYGCVLGALAVAPLGCAGMKDSATGELMPPLGGTASAKRDEMPAAQGAAACYAVGENEEKNNNDAAAMLQYEKAEKLDPTCLPAARRLAVLYDKTSEFAKAEAEYKKVAQARPRDAELFADWGYSCYLRNDWNEAVRKLQRAVELDPKNARARCNLGMALGALDRYEQALDAFRAAGLSEADSHSDLAFVYLTKGKMTEARREAEFARVKDPFCVKANELLAKMNGPARAADSSVQSAAHHDAAAPGTTPSQPPVEPGVNPIYKSPNGTMWAPVKKAAAAAAEEPAGEPGTLVMPDE
jgi:Flp pilus assembly protein TadD